MNDDFITDNRKVIKTYDDLMKYEVEKAFRVNGEIKIVFEEDIIIDIPESEYNDDTIFVECANGENYDTYFLIEARDITIIHFPFKIKELYANNLNATNKLNVLDILSVFRYINGYSISAHKVLGDIISVNRIQCTELECTDILEAKCAVIGNLVLENVKARHIKMLETK